VEWPEAGGEPLYKMAALWLGSRRLPGTSAGVVALLAAPTRGGGQNVALGQFREPPVAKIFGHTRARGKKREVLEPHAKAAPLQALWAAAPCSLGGRARQNQLRLHFKR
jgi:hypothetical protein